MGTVFNIQHFSIHDGPGIRTVVFIKGCPLRCKWCANPESQSGLPELGWTKGSCLHCGSCVSGLKNLDCRFKDGHLFWDASVLPDLQMVYRVCPSEALHVIGKEMSVREVIHEVEKDWQFHLSSGGGVTVSGGEPMMQPQFTWELLKAAGERQIHRTVETCGLATWETFRQVVSETDFLMADVKVMDAELHRKWTGISNERILENLRRARETFPDLRIQIRTPVIPGVNDQREALSEIVDFVNGIQADYELLKYHQLGLPKYESLNREYPMGDVTLSEERFRELEQDVIRRFKAGNTGRYYGKAKPGERNLAPSFTEGAGI